MRYLSVVIVLTLFYSCSPQLYYLGDTYPATTTVDTYYSAEDISQRYRVIGQLSGSNETNVFNDLDKIKRSMIEEAKKRGADGILFLFADSFDNQHNVKADLIHYLD